MPLGAPGSFGHGRVALGAGLEGGGFRQGQGECQA